MQQQACRPSGGWWLRGSNMYVFLLYTLVYLCNANFFYKTMKYKKMNEWYFLNICASTVNIYYGFLHSIKIVYMGLEFYNAMMRIFILFFSNADVEM